MANTKAMLPAFFSLFQDQPHIWAEELRQLRYQIAIILLLSKKLFADSYSRFQVL